MKENLVLLAKLLSTDDAFNLAFSSAKTDEEKFELAKSKIDDLTRDDFSEFLQRLREAAKNNLAQLSPDELENVSGGFGGGLVTKLAATAMFVTALGATGIMSQQSDAIGHEAFSTAMSPDQLSDPNKFKELFYAPTTSWNDVDTAKEGPWTRFRASVSERIKAIPKLKRVVKFQKAREDLTIVLKFLDCAMNGEAAETESIDDLAKDVVSLVGSDTKFSDYVSKLFGDAQAGSLKWNKYLKQVVDNHFESIKSFISSDKPTAGTTTIEEVVDRIKSIRETESTLDDDVWSSTSKDNEKELCSEQVAKHIVFGDGGNGGAGGELGFVSDANCGCHTVAGINLADKISVERAKMLSDRGMKWVIEQLNAFSTPLKEGLKRATTQIEVDGTIYDVPLDRTEVVWDDTEGVSEDNKFGYYYILDQNGNWWKKSIFPATWSQKRIADELKNTIDAPHKVRSVSSKDNTDDEVMFKSRKIENSKYNVQVVLDSKGQVLSFYPIQE